MQPAERVPEIIPRQLSAAHSLEVPPPPLAAARAAAPAVSAAAAAQLPDSDDGSLEGTPAQGSSEEPDVSEAGRAQLPSSADGEGADESDAGSVTAAARAQLPDSDEDSLTEGEDSDPEPGSPPACGLDAQPSSEAAPESAGAPQAGASAPQPASASTGTGGKPWRTLIGGPVHTSVSSAIDSWADTCSLWSLLNAPSC